MGAVEVHDVGVLEFPHDLDLLELARRKPEEVGTLDLLDGDESPRLVVVAAVDGAERAAAQADEAVVDEAVGDLRVAGEVELLLLLLLHINI